MKKDPDQILSEQRSKTKLSLLICLSLLAAAVILLPAGQIMGWVFLAMSATLAGTLYLKKRRNQQELAKLGDLQQAKEELRSSETEYYEPFALTLSRRFAILEQPALQVFPFDSMTKFEVGLAGDVRKVLFLTDCNGKRHPIAETRKDDDKQAEFDRVYLRIRNTFAEKAQNN